jgi:hypothetical protein
VLGKQSFAEQRHDAFVITSCHVQHGMRTVRMACAAHGMLAQIWL